MWITGYDDVPSDSSDYIDPAMTGPMRDTMKPLQITQPEVRLSLWKTTSCSGRTGRSALALTGERGLTLHDISFNDRGTKRAILNRASISEMVVPYGEPQPTHDWQNYFDAGEYQFGRLANSLVLGCDCLGEIHYVDATVADDLCNPIEIRMPFAFMKKTLEPSGNTLVFMLTGLTSGVSAALSCPFS